MAQYQVGGSLTVDSSVYVYRQADFQLYEALKRGEFCYIFSSRQMGKSSLLVKTKDRLQRSGFQCTNLDLTIIGSEEVTPLQWYKGITADLWTGFNLPEKITLKSWWRDREDISLLKRLSEFIEELLCVQFPKQRLVIFVDEIDSVLGLKFPVDDFFALIRYCYNQRAINPEYQRITFALFGVVTPGDLIRDKRKTPFNIGTVIDLTGFKLDEVEPLIKGLAGKTEQPKIILQKILAWTAGQPFLTQKLCQLVAENNFPSLTSNSIDNLAIDKIIDHWESQDEPEHLRTIRDRLLLNSRYVGRILGIYQQILQGNCLQIGDSREKTELLLSGLVIKQEEKLRVKNRIYAEVFSLEWVERQLQLLRPYSQAFQAWIESKFSDRSRLLRGRSLKDARQWMRGKSLSDLDYQFIAESEKLDRQQAELLLELQRKQEVEARLQLEKISNKRLRWLVAIIGTALLGITVLGVATFLLYFKALKSERQAKKQEIIALTSSSQARFRSNQRLDALVDAIRAKRAWQNLKIDDSKLQTRINNTLRQSIYGAMEANRFTVAETNINAVAFSPDGKTIISGSASYLKFWGRDGKLLKTINYQNDPIYTMDYSRDGKAIAVGTNTGKIQILNSQGSLQSTLTGHKTAIWDLAFSANSQYLVTSSQDGTIKVWRENKLIKTIAGNNNATLYTVDISANGELIASGWSNGTVKIWQRDGTLISSFQDRDNIIWKIVFNPINNVLATGGEDGIIHLLHTNGTVLKTRSGHTAPIWKLKYSRDGQLLVSSSVDKTAKVWSKAGVLLRSLEGHESSVWGIGISPDNSTIATTSLDRSIRLWRIENHPIDTITLEEQIARLAFSPDERTLAIAVKDNTIRLWNIEQNQLYNLGSHRESPTSVDFSSDNKFIVSGGLDSSVRVWSRNGKLISTFTGHQDFVTDVVNLSPKAIASIDLSGAVKLWQKDGTLLNSVQLEHSLIFGDLDVSPDSKYIAIAANDKQIRILDSQGQLKQSIKTKHSVDAVSYSPNGKLLAAASSNGKITLRDTQGQLQGTITSSPSDKYSTRVKFSPNGQMIAVTTRDRVELWNKKGTLIKTLIGHQGDVSSIDFSNNGKILATGAYDKTIKLWNLEEILELDELIFACNWVGDYLKNNSQIDRENRNLCDL